LSPNGDRASVEEHTHASTRLEEACDFTGAAREALLAGDPRRAAQLAALGGDDALAETAIRAIVETLPREIGLRAAADLAARGFGRHAGVLFAELGAHVEAGSAFAAAGDACRAARSFDLAGRPADGARALEAALRLRPGSAAYQLELGRLLARHGRPEAAVKHLQQIDPASPERAASLPLLRRCLIELGFEEAVRALREEMDRLGIGEETSTAPPSAPSATPVRAVASQAHAPLLFGRYESVREIARTAHARVIEAFDCINGEQVAVKIIAGIHEGSGRDALLRFEREARALAKLRHPNVVPLRAYHPEGPAIVLAWMSGGSLAERMQRAGDDIAPARAVEIACAVLSALGEAHRLGILHRDVKPSNVLFDDIGATRLGDFGAAHLGDLEATATAGAIGTFAYMSPEQRLGRPARLASDLYGVGVLLAELLTGEAQSPVIERLALPPSACHPDLNELHDALVARLLQEDPKKRPADAFEARRLLHSVHWPPRIWKRERRRSMRPPSERPPATQRARLAASIDPSDGRDAALRYHDTWLDHDVLVLPMEDDTLARVNAFARAGHPALPTVLRVDEDAGAVWVAVPRGRALADEPRGLSPGQIACLREGVLSLHAAEGAHGCIDAEHLYFHDGHVTLAFPRTRLPLEQAAARDRQALDRLAEGA
jgi:serine/threonine-protein kinase